MPACRARPARVLRGNNADFAARIKHVLVKHAKEHSPTLIVYETIEASLLLDVFTRFFDGPRRRFDHVLNPQILTADDGAVLADVSGDFSQMTATDIGDSFVKTGNSFFHSGRRAQLQKRESLRRHAPVGLELENKSFMTQGHDFYSGHQSALRAGSLYPRREWRSFTALRVKAAPPMLGVVAKTSSPYARAIVRQMASLRPKPVTLNSF